MAGRKDVKSRIASVKNIHKITRAMEMVAAARLRRAEQRIEALRPYANAIRRMASQAAVAAGHVPQVPILVERESAEAAGILLLTGDRGLAGSFNANILRQGMQLKREQGDDRIATSWYAVGRRGASSLTFRGEDLTGRYVGFTDRPAYADARAIAEELVAAYVDGQLDRVDIIYNHYISPLNQRVSVERLLPLQEADVLGEEEERAELEAEARELGHDRALWEYEPEPVELLKQLASDYVEISVFRALLESTASEHGARMTAMRNAAESAEEMIQDLTLEANRVRQAEITQEIMEVVAGAEALG